MKKTTLSLRRFLAVGSFLCLFGGASAQSLKDFFNDSNVPLMYLGLDFTRTKVIDDNSANALDIQQRQYAGLNDLVIDEAKKYDVKGAFHRSSIDHDLGTVLKRNQSINAEAILSTNTADYHRLNEDSIGSLVKGFDFGTKKGIGLLLVVEALSKSNKASAIWVTFVDMTSKKVLLTERLEGKAGMGFGWRNYWATTIRSVLEEIDRKKYKEWKAKYGG